MYKIKVKAGILMLILLGVGMGAMGDFAAKKYENVKSVPFQKGVRPPKSLF